MLGTDNLKRFLKAGLDLSNQLSQSTQDGWQWTDALAVIDELSAIPGALKTWKDVLAEIKDLDDTERADLYDFVKSTYDIADDRVEGMVEYGIMYAMSTVSLIELFKKPAA